MLQRIPITYTLDEAVASRALDLLMFLACSRTLDLASSIDAPLTVERARTNCVDETAFEAAGTRILEAERDMLAAAAAKRTATTTRAESPGKLENSWSSQGESINRLRVILTPQQNHLTDPSLGLGPADLYSAELPIG